ncbi:MAG: hypothetical protein H0X64_08480 [Gemmatimonadaceae bacterium]|nr:hypothetical protein [Gemmatimonadaceae bacterium]
MPLPVFEKQDEIPEAFRSEYEEREAGGVKKWHLKVEDTAPLKAKNQQLLDETKAEKRKRQELEEQVAELQRTKAAADAGVTGEKLKEIEAGIEKKYAKDRERADAAEARLKTQSLSTALSKAMDAAGVRPERKEALERLVGDKFDLTDDGKVFVKDDASLGLDAFFKDAVKKDYPEFYTGSQAAGGGAAGAASGGGGAPGAKPPTQWSSDERAEYIQTNGQEAYRGLLNEHLRTASQPATK